jgi:hypothetical protein
MGRIIIAICIIGMLGGCATSHVATKMGENIADSFANSAAIGLVSADKIKASWPYTSGLLKGLAAGDYDREVPYSVQEIMDSLDTICAQETVTPEEKGTLIGLVVRLEYQGGKFFWEKYGVSLWKWFKIFLTGA